VDFLIIALCIFLAVKLINHFRRKQETEPEQAPPPRDVQLLEEIRDLLKNRTKS
jgi:large conductance mechanosensitive channel